MNKKKTCPRKRKELKCVFLIAYYIYIYEDTLGYIKDNFPQVMDTFLYIWKKILSSSSLKSSLPNSSICVNNAWNLWVTFKSLILWKIKKMDIEKGNLLHLLLHCHIHRNYHDIKINENNCLGLLDNICILLAWIQMPFNCIKFSPNPFAKSINLKVSTMLKSCL